MRDNAHVPVEFPVVEEGGIDERHVDRRHLLDDVPVPSIPGVDIGKPQHRSVRTRHPIGDGLRNLAAVRHRQHLDEERTAEIDRIRTEIDMAVIDEQRPRDVALQHRAKAGLRPHRHRRGRERLPAELGQTGVVTEVTVGEQDSVDDGVVSGPRHKVIEHAKLLADRRRRVDQPASAVRSNDTEASRKHTRKRRVRTALGSTADLRSTAVLPDPEDDHLGLAATTRFTRHARTVTGRRSALGNVSPVNGSHPVVYGAMWCKDCRRSKELLSRLGVDHDDVDLEAEPDRAAEAEALSGRKRIPVIHFDDGLVLSEPSDAELEQALRERGLVST